MNNKRFLFRGFALVEIMLIVATTAVLAVFSIPKVLRTNMADNVSAAQVILKTTSTAAENYAVDNNGKYPAGVTELITAANEATPPYLKENYCDGKIRNGYIFSCSFDVNNKGYVITAKPRKCKVTGDKSFAMTTGGVFSTDATCLAAGKDKILDNTTIVGYK